MSIEVKHQRASRLLTAFCLLPIQSTVQSDTLKLPCLKHSPVKASTERKLLRWFHIIASIPVVGYIYGPVSKIPEAVTFLRYILFPLIVLSGLWMWKGYAVKKWFNG